MLLSQKFFLLHVPCHDPRGLVLVKFLKPSHLQPCFSPPGNHLHSSVEGTGPSRSHLKDKSIFILLSLNVLSGEKWFTHKIINLNAFPIVCVIVLTSARSESKAVKE